MWSYRRSYSHFTLNFFLFLWTFARSESYIKNGIEVHRKWGKAFWAVVLTNFKHAFDLIIKIIIPLYNTIRTIVFESRNSMDSTLPFLIQRNISHNIACRYCCCFQEYILFSCWVCICIKSDKWMWCNPIMFKCRW